MGTKFQKRWLAIMGVMLCGLLCLGSLYLPKAQAAAGDGWTFVDGNLSTGLNKDTARNAVDPVMALYNNELYMAWTENNSSTTQIRVRKYNGSSWSWVDGGSTTGINYNTAEAAGSPYLFVFNSNLYAIWSELYSGASVTRVKRYDGGSTWTSIDGSATNGLNKQSVTSQDPTLSSCNGYMYAAWVESYSGASQLHVKRYDSGTSWSFVDGGGFTGLNIDTSKTATKPKLFTLNNVLYLIWTEVNASAKSQIRVKRFDGGTTWTIVDGGGGLNYNSGYSVAQANLAIYNNSLYAYWLENYRVRVKSYNGSAWSTADGNAGFLQNDANYCYPEASPKAITYNNKLYFTWGEDISISPWAIQIRAGRYASATMTMIDGNDSECGLNHVRDQYAYMPAICEYNGSIYIAWYEGNGSANQIRVRSTPLPPIVTSVTVPANGWYKAGQNLDFTVTFNKTVTVTGTPVIPLTLTSGTVNASYVSGSGTAALTFRYTVATGNTDADGIAVGTDMSLAGGTIRDSSSVDAQLNLNSTPSTTGVLVDGVAPTKTSTNPLDDATDVTANQNLIIYFSENITKGTGNITIRKYSDDSLVDTIDVGSARVTVSTNSATIDPSVTFDSTTGYYVQIATTAFTDGAGNSYTGFSGKNQWNFTTRDTTPPSGYSVSIDQPYINNENKTALSFTFAGAEASTSYNYTLTSSGGGTPVTGSGTVSSATQQVTGVTTFGLNEGTLTLSVTLTDAALNTGAPATDTVLKDTLMPSGYSVAIDQTLISTTNQASMSFVISGAETGASYTYSVTSSGGGTPVNGSGTVTSGTTKSVTGVNTTGLGDGTLTVSVTMTDVPGNPGLPVTDTVTKDTTAPSGYSVAIDQPYINNTNKTALSFTFAGADIGATYHYTISDIGTGTVSNEGTISSVTQTISGINVSSLVDGTLTLNVFLFDSAGNIGATVTDTVLKDIVPPSGYSINIDQAYINNNNKTALSFTFISGRVGTTYNYTLTSSGGGTPVTGSGTVSSATQQISGVTTMGLGEGTLTLSVTLTDVHENTGVPATDTALKDTLLPTGYTVNIDQAVVNDQNKNAVSFTISGAEIGASYIYSITSNGGGTPVTGGGSASSSTYQQTGISVGGLADGILTLSLTMADVAGNSGSQVTNTVVKDVNKPAGYSATIEQSAINNANKADLHLTIGAPEAGSTYNYSVTSSGAGTPVTGSGAVPSGSDLHITGINTTGLGDGTLTLSVTLTDSAGNVGLPVTDTVNKDTVAPTVVLSSNDSDNLAKPGDIVTFTATFSEAMASAPTITIINGGVSGAAMNDSGDQTIWTYVWTVPTGVSASTIPLGAELIVNITAEVSVAGNDLAGNPNHEIDTPLEFTIDNTAPSMMGATATDNTHITVTLNEDCKNFTKSNDGGFTVCETGNPSITYAVSATAMGVNRQHVVLTVADLGVSAKEGVTVRYTAGTNGTIKDMAGNNMGTDSEGVKVAGWDTTAPTLVSAVWTSYSSITVALSENSVNLAQSNSGGFTVEETGNPSITYAVSATTQGSDTSHLVLTVANLKCSGKEGVTVKYTAGGNGIIQDVAGNSMGTNSAGVNIAPWDTTPPAITTSILDSSNSFIDITFSEGVFGADTGSTGLTADDLSLTFAANGGNATNVTISSVKKNNSTVEASAADLTGNETIIRVFLNITGNPSGVETIVIKPANNSAIYDKAGNASTTSETTGTKLLNDKLGPVMISAIYTDNTHLTVTLSEPSINLTKANDGGFTVNQFGSATITYAVSAIAQGVDASHVVLTIADMGISAKEGVKVKYTAGGNGTIQDTLGNDMATTITGVKVPGWDTTAPTVVSVTRTSNTKLTVMLSEACVNLANSNNGGFTVEETGNPGFTYAVTATAQGVDASYVVLTVANLRQSGREGVTVKYTAGGYGIIEDIAGNVMETNSTGVNAAPWDLTPPAISSSTLDASNGYIDITFSEGIFGADTGSSPIAADDLALTFTANGGAATNVVISSVKKNNSAVEASASALTGNETTIRVFLNLTGSPSGVETIAIKPANDTAIFDVAGNATLSSVSTGAKLLYDKLPPTIVSVVRTNNTHITVTLSEDCPIPTQANDGGFTVNQLGAPTITYAVTAIAQGVTASQVVLTVANMLVSAREGVKVKYAAGANGTIQDTAGNAMATPPAGFNILAWDTTPPTITSGVLAASNGYLDITFSEGVYGTSNGTGAIDIFDGYLIFMANGGTATGVTITSVKKNNSAVESSASALTGGETVVRAFLSVTGTPSGVETIEITPFDGASIFDRAGNAVLATETTGAKILNDKLAPTIVSVVRTDDTHLLVTLSEDCTDITKVGNGGFTVNQLGNPTIVYTVTAIAQGVDAQHVILTIADMSASAGAGVKVKYTAGINGTIRDLAGNPVATPPAGFNIMAWGLIL